MTTGAEPTAGSMGAFDAGRCDPAALAVAARTAVDGQYVARRTPIGAVKRAVRLATKPVTARLVLGVQLVARAVEELEEARESDTAVQAARVDALRAEVGRLTERLRTSEDAAVRDRAAVRRALAADAGGAGARPESSVVDEDDDPALLGALDDATYLEFERRFRGSREAILERQRDCIRFVGGLPGDAPLLDLGCGRGEWLEVLRDVGVPAFGVDSNAEMVRTGRERGLDVRHGDLVEYLEGVAPGSLGAVSGFHVAEHVPLPVLRRLLDAAYRAVRPGGLLLMETPNPMNVMVGSASFYLDPTHLRPLHPFFFGFLVERHGFSDVAVHYVHPAAQELVLAAPAEPTAQEKVLEAVSVAIFGAQDYVIVARRPDDADAAG